MPGYACGEDEAPDVSRPEASRGRDLGQHQLGWTAPETFEVRECPLIVLNGEWHHRQFAERDLDALEGR